MDVRVRSKINGLLEEATVVLAYLEDGQEVPLKRRRTLRNSVDAVNNVMQDVISPNEPNTDDDLPF